MDTDVNGRVAKQLRREGIRTLKNREPVKMDLGTVSLKFDKKLYRERRKKGLSGQIKVPTVFDAVLDDDGNKVLIPSSTKISHASSHLQRKDNGKNRDSRFTTKGHGEFVRRHMAHRSKALDK